MPELLALLPGFVLLAVAAIPYVFYPLALTLLARGRTEEAVETDPDWRGEGMALVFCAYNEALRLPAKMKGLKRLKARYPNLAIHAYSDGSSDETATILDSHSDIVRPVLSTERTGKSIGMNTLMGEVDARLVIFTDADARLDDDAPAVAQARFMAEPGLGCLCGKLAYTNAGASSSAMVSGVFWRLEERIKTLESRIGSGSTMGAAGALFAIRRKLYREVPVDIIDDMFTSVSILSDGWRVAPERRFVAHLENAETSGDEFRRKIRIACRAMNCHRLLWPKLARMRAGDLAKYLCHKVMRWWSGYIAALGALALLAGWFAIAGTPLFWSLAVPGGVGAVAVLAVPRLRAALRSIVVMLLGTSIGVLHAYRGRRYASWTTARDATVTGR